MEIQLSPDLETKLTSLAAQQGRDTGSLVVEAVERLVHYDQWFLAEVEKGLAQVKSGQTLSHEKVGSRIESYVSKKMIAS